MAWKATMRAAITTAMTVAVTLSAACTEGATGFLCEDDAGCGEGLCEPNGFCSFADAACPSGRRYGANSTEALQGTCVTPDEGTGDGPGEASTGTDTAPPLPTDASSSSGTTGTTEPPDETTDGESSGGAEESSGTTEPPATVRLPCGPIAFTEDHEFFQLITAPIGAVLTIQDEDTMEAEFDLSSTGYDLYLTRGQVEFLDTSISIRIDSWTEEPGPEDGSPAQVGLSVGQTDSPASVRAFSAGGSVCAVISFPNMDFGNPVCVDRQSFPVWLRISEDAGVATVSHSYDGETFVALESMLTPAFFAEADVAADAGIWISPPEPRPVGVAQVSAFSACDE